MKLLTQTVTYAQTIELDKSNRYHVHLLADGLPEELKPIIESLLNSYLDGSRNYRLYCEPIYNIGSSVDYLLKNPQ